MLKQPLIAVAVLCFKTAPLSHGFGILPSLPISSLPIRTSSHFRRDSSSTRPPFVLGLSEEESPPSDAEESVDASSSESTQTVKEHGVSVVKSLFQRIDDGGQKLKPMALNAKEKATSESSKKSVMYTIKSCMLFSLFIVYRAYRGFFVILPAVFREVYRKMDNAVESPFVDDEDLPQDLNAKTGKVRIRTAVTTSVLASVVTASYVIGGALRVLGKFLKTATSTSKVATSFEAAADEVVINEEKITRMTKREKDMGDETINGEGLNDLAP